MDIANVVAALKEERGRIDKAIAALESLGSAGRRARPELSQPPAVNVAV